MLNRASLSSTALFGPRKKTGADPVSLGTEPEIKARGLYLIGIKRSTGGKLSTVKQRADSAIRKNTSAQFVPAPCCLRDLMTSCGD
jgi:hypothetical protein